MSSATMTKVSAATVEKHKVIHAPASKPVFVQGRRDFFKYRDLGVTAASGGHMRAQVTIGTRGLTRPTGWHHHVCEGQFVYMLKGWIELQFEDGRTIKVEQGDSLYIPGGVRHNETRASDDLEILEVSIPADMGTEPSDPPEGWPIVR
jgi:mannose-6-phosphate isomerase-like protein (cupin superfamily)